MCVDLHLKVVIRISNVYEFEKAVQYFLQFTNVRLLKMGFIILKNVSCKTKTKQFPLVVYRDYKSA